MSGTCASCGGTGACGCCAGIQVAVPVSEANPPGLTQLSFRVGTYATFYETMLARLTGLVLQVPAPTGNGTISVMPLAALTTRDPTDPAIALLDAWAVVADVLTFYQERIANEGYLPTAVERRSLLELSRLIGYRLRPGVSASVKLAFTVSNGFIGTLPAGTRAQSLPGTGQTAQFFETSAAVPVRAEWNALAPRLGRPQLITPIPDPDSADVPLVTGADVIDSVYFGGIATGLNPGDPLLFVFGPNADPSATPQLQCLRMATDVDAQAAQNRTAVTLELEWPAARSVAKELQLYVNKANFLFPGSDIAQQVVAVLKPTIGNITNDIPMPAQWLTTPLARIALLRGVAVKRGFTRVTAWLTMLLQVMQRASASAAFPPGNSDSAPKPLPETVPASPLAGLGQLMAKLAQAPSRPPASALALPRSVASSFSPQSDMAPRLLATLQPAAAPSLYPAWSALATPAGSVEVYAMRAKAGLFAGNWSGPATVNGAGTATVTTSYNTEPTIANAWASAVPESLTTSSSTIAELPLDTTYDKIKPGSWVAIDRPTFTPGTPATPTGGRTVTYHLVVSTRTGSVASAGVMISVVVGVEGGSPPPPGSPPLPPPTITIVPTGFTAKVTLLTLQPNWLDEDAGIPAKYGADTMTTEVLRGTIVYAQSEALTLTNEPLDTDVAGGSLDLAGVQAGIEPGRWVMVSGTRTDIPNVSGVPASELAMIAGVVQGEQAPMCANFTFAAPPFRKIWYTTDADAYGDRLVVGEVTDTASFQKQLDGLAAPAVLNQQYCNQVELAPGFFANAYVPTATEKKGQFPTFAGLLVNPKTHIPVVNGNLKGLLEEGIFAWRVSSQALQTTLTLATPLSYSYDRASITIYGNVADATHGQSTGEVLGNGDATKAWLSFTLSQSPLTYVSAPTAAGATSTLAVKVNELQWSELYDFAEAGPNQRGFVTRETGDQKTTVTFGNGVRGARVPTGTANVKATYRYGIGSPGNVDAQQISQLATHPLGAQAVINPLPASGGVDADRLDQARANAPVSTTALDRLVSVSDYADFCRTYAGIGKATAVRLSDGRALIVHVTIAGADDAPIDTGSDLFNNLLTSLQTYGDPYQPAQVAVRRVRLIVMAATVVLQTGWAWEDVAPNLRTAVLALFAFNARDLGQTAFLSEAVATLQAARGVAWLNVTTFDSVPESITAAQLATLGSTLGKRPYILSELAYVNTSAAPGSTNRIVPAELVFMTPDIPDTLILTQAAT